MCSVTRRRDWPDKVRWLTCCYVYLSNDNYVFTTIWCRGFHGKRDFHELLKKARAEISLGSIGNHGDWVMVFVAKSYDFGIFDLFSLDLWLWLHPVYGHTTLLVLLYYYWSSWPSSWLVLVISCYVSWILGIGFGK